MHMVATADAREYDKEYIVTMTLTNTRTHGSTQQNPHKTTALAPPSRKSRSRTPAVEPTQIFTIRVIHIFLQFCFKHDPDSRELMIIIISLISIYYIISSLYDEVVVIINLAAISVTILNG
jgi:hypothetical protein